MKRMLWGPPAVFVAAGPGVALAAAAVPLPSRFIPPDAARAAAPSVFSASLRPASVFDPFSLAIAGLLCRALFDRSSPSARAQGYHRGGPPSMLFAGPRGRERRAFLRGGRLRDADAVRLVAAQVDGGEAQAVLVARVLVGAARGARVA